MARLSLALDSIDLPSAELQAMRLDGQLFGLAGSWCPIDVAETPEVRARAVMAGRSPRLVAELRTAAWIWGVLPVLPRPLELCADVRARARVRPGADAVVRELVLDDADVIRFGLAAVTSPLRTLIDLARSDAADADLLREIAAVGRIDGDQALASLAGRILPGRRAAAVAIEAALG